MDNAPHSADTVAIAILARTARVLLFLAVMLAALGTAYACSNTNYADEIAATRWAP